MALFLRVPSTLRDLGEFWESDVVGCLHDKVVWLHLKPGQSHSVQSHCSHFFGPERKRRRMFTQSWRATPRTRSPFAALLLALFALMFLGAGSSAHAQRVQANYTAVITSVEDPFNVFNNTIVVGGAVQGSFSYNSDLSKFYEPDFRDNRAGYYTRPSNNATFSASIGGVTLTAFPSPLMFVGVTNDAPGIGDGFTVTSGTLDFPAAYNIVDPDFINFETSYPFMRLNFADPSGVAFSSLDLPTSVPNFATGEGFLVVSVNDLNTGDEFESIARFRLTSLTPTAVPEPGPCVLLTACLIAGGLCLRRRSA